MPAARPSRFALTRLPPVARRMLWFVVAVALLMAVAALSPSEEGGLKSNPFPGAAWPADGGPADLARDIVPRRDGCRMFNPRVVRDAYVVPLAPVHVCE